MKHQIDQNNKIILKILSSNSQVESNLEKSDNNLQKSNKKNPLVKVVKENISKLPKGVKIPQKQKKVTKERKSVFIIDDLIIKGLAETGISKDHNVKVRPQPGCTTEDIEDHIKPILRKNPDAIIIHSGTNDVTNDKPTKKKIKKVVKLIEDTNPAIQVIISGLIHREDREVNDEIASINNQLESYCNSKNFLFVNNDNMKSSCLAKDKLHLNKTGNSIFAKNIISVLKKGMKL